MNSIGWPLNPGPLVLVLKRIVHGVSLEYVVKENLVSWNRGLDFVLKYLAREESDLQWSNWQEKGWLCSGVSSWSLTVHHFKREATVKLGGIIISMTWLFRRGSASPLQKNKRHMGNCGIFPTCVQALHMRRRHKKTNFLADIIGPVPYDNKSLWIKQGTLWEMHQYMMNKYVQQATTFTNYSSIPYHKWPYSNIPRHNPTFINIYENICTKVTQFRYHRVPLTYHNLSLHISVHQHSPFSTQPTSLSTQFWEII